MGSARSPGKAAAVATASAPEVEARLLAAGDPELAAFQQRFFKTGPGGYGEGDVFLGIKVPAVRQIAREFRSLPLPESTRLLDSPFHEARLAALIIVVEMYRRADESTRQAIHELYLARSDRVNGWDLVDVSAATLIGQHLFERDRSMLSTLARSDSVWERRMAIIATHYFIRRGDFRDTFQVAGLLLADRHDLIHKAVGWMLREVGNRDVEAEKAFLRDRYRQMPRTMLRYAIEKFPEEERKKYLLGEI